MIYTNYLQNKILSTNTTSKVLYYGSSELLTDLDVITASYSYKIALQYINASSGYIYLCNLNSFTFYNNKFLSIDKPEILDVIYIGKRRKSTIKCYVR